MLTSMGRNLPPRVFIKSGRYYHVRADGKRRICSQSSWEIQHPCGFAADSLLPIGAVLTGFHPRSTEAR